MKKLIATFLFAFPAVAMADYVDVLSAKLEDGCSIATFQQIVADRNATWAQGGDYTAQLMIPVKSEDLHALYWVGRARGAVGLLARFARSPISVAARSALLQSWMATKDPGNVGSNCWRAAATRGVSGVAKFYILTRCSERRLS